MIKTRLTILWFAMLIALGLRSENTTDNIYLIDGIYYSVVSETPKEVAVVCGNKTNKDLQSPLDIHKEIMLYEWMTWTGNSYSGDVDIPPTISIPDLGTDPYDVTQIADAAFINCADIRSVSIPPSIKGIGGGAFSNCTSIKEIILPDNITFIGPRAFMFCRSMTHLHYSTGCSYICELALCTMSDDKILIDGLENVKGISDYGISCVDMENFPYMPSLEYIDLFGVCNTRIINLDLSYIEDGTDIFCYGAFEYNHLLKSVILAQNAPDNSNKAFSDCPAINYIKIFNTEPPALSADWAAQIDPECVLDVPDGSLDLYRNAPYWKNFPIIKEHSAGINTPAALMPHIEAGAGHLNISSQTQVSVFDANGRLQAVGTSLNLSLPCGVYLISDGHISKKVLVK